MSVMFHENVSWNREYILIKLLIFWWSLHIKGKEQTFQIFFFFFFAIIFTGLYRGDIFYNFLLAFLFTEPLQEKGSTEKGKNPASTKKRANVGPTAIWRGNVVSLSARYSLLAGNLFPMSEFL